MNKHTKKPTQKQNRIYMVRTALALVLVVLFFAVGGGIIYVKNQTSTQTFTSDSMKIQFLFPNEYLVQHSADSVVLKKNQSDITSVIITESGTNFTDTKSHVDTSLLRKRVTPYLRRDMEGENINGEMVEYITGGKPYRIYYFVTDYTIYQFEANDPALFSDLDAIAKSFRILE